MIWVGQASGAHLLLQKTERRAALVNFTISLDSVSPLHLPHSGFASPGRYLAEMLRSLQFHDVADARRLVINPRYRPSPRTIQHIVHLALESSRGEDFCVIADRRLRVAGILFQNRLAEADIPILSAVSADNAYLDRRFLEVMFGWRGDLKVHDLELGEVGDNGFVLYDRQVQQLPAMLALEAMAGASQKFPDLASARRSLRRVAVMPYHAGDVLFFCQAMQARRLVDAAVVFPAYTPIVRELLPGIEVFEPDCAVPNRDGGERPENEMAFVGDLVVSLRRRLQKEGRSLDGIFYILRQQRDYNVGMLHLRQAFYFGAGGAPEDIDNLFPPERAQRRHPPATSAGRKQVVLHFDGGWPLKSYPGSMRQALVDRLREAGFSPTVLGAPDSGLSGCGFEPFVDLDSYSRLLSRSVAVAGVDSFPAHYAVHYGLPTVQMFASTRPENSDYGRTAISETVSRSRTCTPCGHPTTCRLDEGCECHNAQLPASVVDALLRLFDRKACDSDPAGRGECQEEGDAHALVASAHSAEPVPDLEVVTRCVLCDSTEHRAVGEKCGFPVVACARCGLWFFRQRLPAAVCARLDDEVRLAIRADGNGHLHARERYPFEYWRAAERARYVKRFVSGGRAIDIGCGLGAFPRRLREEGFQVTGVDVHGLAGFAGRYSGIEAQPALPEEDEIDLITIFELFGHFYHPRQDLGRVARRLKPGGTIVAEAFRIDCRAVEETGLANGGIGPLRPPYMYRQEHLLQLVDGAGLDVLDLHHPDGADRPTVRIAARRRG